MYHTCTHKASCHTFVSSVRARRDRVAALHLRTYYCSPLCCLCVVLMKTQKFTNYAIQIYASTYMMKYPPNAHPRGASEKILIIQRFRTNTGNKSTVHKLHACPPFDTPAFAPAWCSRQHCCEFQERNFHNLYKIHWCSLQFGQCLCDRGADLQYIWTIKSGQTMLSDHEIWMLTIPHASLPAAPQQWVISRGTSCTRWKKERKPLPIPVLGMSRGIIPTVFVIVRLLFGATRSMVSSPIVAESARLAKRKCLDSRFILSCKFVPMF